MKGVKLEEEPSILVWAVERGSLGSEMTAVRFFLRRNAGGCPHKECDDMAADRKAKAGCILREVRAQRGVVPRKDA